MQISGIANFIPSPDGKAVLEVAGRPMFELNQVAAVVWQKLVAGLTAQEIVKEITEKFNVSEQQANHDVGKFISLLKQNVLVYDDDI